MSKASQAALEDLHGDLATEIAKVIREGEDVVTKDGDVVKKRASPALLNVARQLLKDNHIESGVGNADLTDIEKALKEMNDLPYKAGAQAN